MQIEKNKQLHSLNTLSVPSVAENFFAATAREELVEALLWAKGKGLKIRVLGGGSNVILPGLLSGLVVQPKIMGFDLYAENPDTVLVTIGGGENWHEIVCRCVDQGLYGIENLALIPGSVGAAPVQNIGAYGVELKDVFHSLLALNIDTLECETFSAQDCAFEYRDSVFKADLRGQYIILKITLSLSTIPEINISYPALKQQLKLHAIENPNAVQIKDAVVEIRSSKLPDPAKTPNAGSFFKNPIVSQKKYSELSEAFPSIAAYDVGNGQWKLAAAWLIESAGWKGKSFAGLRVHPKHALVLTNSNDCDAESVLNIVAAIQRDVNTKFCVQLDMEPQLLE